MSQVKVKPLVWAVSCPGWFEAKTPFGVIGVRVSVFGSWFLCTTAGRIAPGKYLNAEDAKVAAEEWYRDRVMECLKVPDEG
jgi:hypothetical protein